MISGDGARYDKKAFLDSLARFKLTGYKIADGAEVIAAGKDSAVLVYRVTYTLAYKGEKPKTATVVSSSTYALRGGKWVTVFNQETPAK